MVGPRDLTPGHYALSPALSATTKAVSIPGAPANTIRFNLDGKMPAVIPPGTACRVSIAYIHGDGKISLLERYVGVTQMVVRSFSEPRTKVKSQWHRRSHQLQAAGLASYQLTLRRRRAGRSFDPTAARRGKLVFNDQQMCNLPCGNEFRMRTRDCILLPM